MRALGDLVQYSSEQTCEDADLAELTPYDHQHLATYLSLLYAEGEGASIEDMAREILGLNPDLDPDRARATVENHLARARWLTTSGYKLLLESEADSASDRPFSI